MEHTALKQLLDSLIATWENEVVEFKEADDNYSTSEIGKYFSALANEANLRGHEKAWLVFGVNNKTRAITTSDYRIEPERLQGTKKQIADGTEPSITFRNIHELHTPDVGRVVLFEIPAAPRGMPIAWNGHYYARAGESLGSLGLDKLDEIRSQTIATDWSAHLLPEANMSYLDIQALQEARKNFSKKHEQSFAVNEVMSWSDEVFLERVKLMRHGLLTRAAILLLGQESFSTLLTPHPAQMTWKLDAEEKAYQHFSTPFFLNTTRLYQKIRNIQIRILPQDQLIPIELSKYDQKIVLEALHNCIAHQDYNRNGRIIVTEKVDRLVFENEGGFFEGDPLDYLQGEKTPRRYRNPCLAEAMSLFNMIDTMGYGIHRMYKGQASRYFPLPDYDMSEGCIVKMTIHGRVVDEAYSRLLIKKTDLSLLDILALDRVQKNLPLGDDEIQRLRRSGLIEGRKPNLHVSASVAAATDNKAAYIRTRAQDDAHYAKLIMDYLQTFGQASRHEINTLLKKHLSDALNDYQKGRKIGNLLTKLRRAGRIYNAGSDKKPTWKIAE